MALYKILFKRSAEKELQKVPSSHISPIINKIQTLSKNPRPSGVDMFKGEGRYCRLRNTDYRIIYEVDDAKREVIITKIGHRREVYD